MMFQGEAKNLYVIRLRQDVLYWEEKFEEENKHYDPASEKPCVYVGLTAHEPQCRFEQHKNGHKAGRGFVTKYRASESVMPEEQYAPEPRFLNPVPAREAEKLERALGQRLKDKGWAVYGPKP